MTDVLGSVFENKYIKSVEFEANSAFKVVWCAALISEVLRLVCLFKFQIQNVLGKKEGDSLYSVWTVIFPTIAKVWADSDIIS